MYKNLLWAYLAQIFNIGSSFLLLPLVVYYLSQEEVGLWFVFITLLALAQLIDMGFQPTISRNVSYIYSGTDKLLKNGFSENKKECVNLELLNKLFIASQKIYFKISIYASLILLGFGSLYIYSLLSNYDNKLQVFFSWFIYSISYIINLYYGYLSAFLYGKGNIVELNKIIVYSRLVYIIISGIMIISGYGIIGLALGMFISTIINRLLSFYYILQNKELNHKRYIFSKLDVNELIKILWPNASKFGIVMIGVFLIWRANVMVAASFLGLSDAAVYGLAIQVFFLLNTISTVPLNVSLPKMNILRSQNNFDRLYVLFNKVLIFQLFVYIISGLCILFLGNFILEYIDSSVRFPKQEILFVMLIIFLLEINHGTCSNFITTGNTIPFVKAAIISGSFIVIFSLIFTPILGIWGLVLSHGIVQLAYNNWKWPLEISKFFKKNYFVILKDGLFNLVIVNFKGLKK